MFVTAAIFRSVTTCVASRSACPKLLSAALLSALLPFAAALYESDRPSHPATCGDRDHCGGCNAFLFARLRSTSSNSFLLSSLLRCSSRCASQCAREAVLISSNLRVELAPLFSISSIFSAWNVSKSCSMRRTLTASSASMVRWSWKSIRPFRAAPGLPLHRSAEEPVVLRGHGVHRALDVRRSVSPLDLNFAVSESCAEPALGDRRRRGVHLHDPFSAAWSISSSRSTSRRSSSSRPSASSASFFPRSAHALARFGTWEHAAQPSPGSLTTCPSFCPRRNRAPRHGVELDFVVVGSF